MLMLAFSKCSTISQGCSLIHSYINAIMASVHLYEKMRLQKMFYITINIKQLYSGGKTSCQVHLVAVLELSSCRGNADNAFFSEHFKDFS